MSELQAWFNRLPFFTRYWFGATVALSLAARFGLVSPYYLILNYDLVLHRFQLWRPITALFFYPISPQTGFHFLINLYFLINYSKRLETDEFGGVPADYAFMLLFNWLCCVVTAIFLNMMTLMDPMVLSVLYIWCNINKDVIVSFWFGTQFKAMYLPWVLFGFNLILSGGGMAELIGILVGHLYFYLKFQHPEISNSPTLVATPQFLRDIFPQPVQRRSGFGTNPSDPNVRHRGHSWGHGQTLGSN